MKSPISKLALEYPRAYENLNSQLSKGGTFKTFILKFLIVLSAFHFISKVPILKGLVHTAKGLVAGHISEIQFIESLSMTQVSKFVAPQLKSFLSDDVKDVVIIGSGPGAVVAAEIEMARGTKSICVIERGSNPKTAQSLHHSLTHVIQDFHQAGQELIVARGFPLYAQANVVGGGSEVNSGLYHNLPDQYVKGYANALGVNEGIWVAAEKQTHSLLAPEEMNVVPTQSLLARGAKIHNLGFKNIPRWRTYFEDGSFQHRGTNEIYWNLNSKGPRLSILGDSEVVAISTQKSEFLEVTYRNTISGEKHVIRAKNIHVAAGAISTPLLLARSGLIKWNDTRFSWHPMIRVVASTSTTDLGAGDIDPFQAWTADRRLKFGAAVSTPPLLSIALGRPVSVKEASKLRSFYVSYSSSGNGGLIPKVGLPWYKFSKLDRSLASEGVALLEQLITSGGGKIINQEKLGNEKYSTVHIFGTLPIDGGIFIPGTNQLKVDSRIRVSDASILPFGPGVNPQGVVMTAVRIANLSNFHE